MGEQNVLVGKVVYHYGGVYGQNNMTAGEWLPVTGE